MQVEKAHENLPPTKHLKSRTTEYNIWTGIKQRCTNPDHAYFRYYGGRGIVMCDRWKENFQNFYDDMGPRPSEGHSVDRINGKGIYEPSNCRWATWEEQARNKSNNRNVTINGVIMCVSQASTLLSISQSKILNMVKKLNISYQEAVDLLLSNPRSVNMRQFREILERKNTVMIDY